MANRKYAYKIGSTSNGTYLDFNLANTTTSGNLLVFIYQNNFSSNTVTTPTGWTSAIYQNGYESIWAYYKVADGTETSIRIYDTALSSSGKGYGGFFEIEGLYYPELDVANGNQVSSGTSLSIPMATNHTPSTQVIAKTQGNPFSPPFSSSFIATVGSIYDIDFGVGDRYDHNTKNYTLTWTYPDGPTNGTAIALSFYSNPPNSPPTTTLNSPANNVSLTTTTPTLAFTATDPDGDDVSYQVQVSTSSSFTTTHMDVTTTTYASGTQQTRVVSPALTQGGIDYYWRVRAKDPTGSNTYGAWSTSRKMTTAALPPTQPEADFTATPTSGKRPVTVQFTDLTKGIPDTWSWNFGDGYTSTQQNPSHPYSKAGTYTVSLTASNVEGTDTVTKTALITIQPEVFTRTAGGTFLLGGNTNRRLIASRTAGGTFLLGGETRAVLIRDAEAIQDKTYLYKVYDPDGNFIEVWKDVADEPQFTHEINSIGSSMTVELARNSDTVGTTTSPILDDDGQAILDDTELPILGSMETRNQIGAGTSVDYNNRVDIVAFYGVVEPLLTESLEPILTEDGEPLLVTVGAPNGRRIFTGFISEINSRYGNTESTVVQLTSYGFDLDQYAITTAYDNNTTTVPFNSFDPSEIARIAMDRFYQAANLEQVSYTQRTTSSIATTGTQVSYTFRNNTYKEVLDKVLELMPSDWYYRVGLGDNTVYFGERSNTPQHLFYLGKHIKSLDLKGSIMDVTNHVLFTGGGEPALYIEEKQAPAARTRRGLEILSDSRVTLDTSARIIAQGKIEAGNKMQNRSTIEILAKQYNIEEIQVGHVVGFRNFGVTDIDTLELIVVGVNYSPDIVQLSLERLPPTVPKRLADINRNLSVQENNFIPTTPS